MPSFPLIKDLQVTRYGLYPGTDGQGIRVEFSQGLTLILGSNGLGKTTLITMIFRMLTGPFDLALPSGSIGTSELKALSLSKSARMAFSARVNDSAQNAEATLNFELGSKSFSVKRSLKDLSLVSLIIDNDPKEATENSFQKEICSTSGLATFGEWILVLRTMVFFFEDRRALVWDPSAQRQLLRCLLLPPEQATSWTNAEREILEYDTRMRNLQAALRREQDELSTTETRKQAAPGVTAALKAAEHTVARLSEKQQELAETVEALDQDRRRYRLDNLRAEQEYDSAVQELERARLTSIAARFPNADSSTQYILTHLISNDECLVCSAHGVEDKRNAMLAAIDHRRCIVCDSPLESTQDSVADLSNERINALREKVESSKEAFHATKINLDDSTKSFDETSKELSGIAVELNEQQQQINYLANQLPPEEQATRRQLDNFAELEKHVTALRATIRTKREKFSIEMAQHREAIRRFASQIKQAFEDAAHGFLLEDCSLSWSPYRSQVGQAGAEGIEPVEYPAFAVELSGGNFSSVVRRDGPDQVSESQREFIDLAFRMALIHVTANNQAGSIVIDAPESSLDIVFVERAAHVLSRFANANDLNRLIVTSNLAAGELIPELMIASDSDPENRSRRIFDLFDNGVSTRAIQQLASDYDRHRQNLYSRISQPMVADNA